MFFDLDGRTLANLDGPDKGPRAAEMHEGEDGYAGRPASWICRSFFRHRWWPRHPAAEPDGRSEITFSHEGNIVLAQAVCSANTRRRSTMLDHVSLGVSDIARSRAFYDA